MVNNNSAIPTTSNYVITSLKSLSLYATILSQYPYITQSQRKHFLIFAYNLENISTGTTSTVFIKIRYRHSTKIW